MRKYRCKTCGFIYDESKEKILFNNLPDDWVCPLCNDTKEEFELIEENIEVLEKAVEISNNNVAIERILEKCTNCGICSRTCKIKEGMQFDSNSELCVNCGQCIQTCPFDALAPKNDINRLKNALSAGKTCIAYTSPAVRVAFKEAFDKERGAFSQDEMVGALRSLGFDYVFDTTYAADLTIMEEAAELIGRIKNKGKLPMFTSCCPAWIKYAEQFYPEILDNISTCKSPIGMMGMVVKKYFCKEKNLSEEDVFTVAITPCTAKKYEITRDEIDGTDLVITTLELTNYLKEKGVKYEDITPSCYDDFFKTGSGAGIIFGNTGGVMEAALRTSYNMLTGKDLDNIEFESVRGYEKVKDAIINIDDLELKVAIVHGMANAKELLEEVKNGNSKYHYIEIMNCEGGCIGDGGQPKIERANEEEGKKKRIEALYNSDKISNKRTSFSNPQIKKIYSEFLEKPGSNKAKELLHTKYYQK